MPTKYNRAGKQQPYVPAGNKDGGEYRGDGFGGESYTPIRKIQSLDRNKNEFLDQDNDIKTDSQKVRNEAVNNLLSKNGQKDNQKIKETFEKAIESKKPLTRNDLAKIFMTNDNVVY